MRRHLMQSVTSRKRLLLAHLPLESKRGCANYWRNETLTRNRQATFSTHAIRVGVGVNDPRQEINSRKESSRDPYRRG